MLVLTRRLNESFYIGKDVKVTVVSIGGGQVKIGIEAPKEVSIVRSELTKGKNNGQTNRKLC